MRIKWIQLQTSHQQPLSNHVIPLLDEKLCSVKHFEHLMHHSGSNNVRGWRVEINILRVNSCRGISVAPVDEWIAEVCFWSYLSVAQPLFCQYSCSSWQGYDLLFLRCCSNSDLLWRKQLSTKHRVRCSLSWMSCIKSADTLPLKQSVILIPLLPLLVVSS